MTDLADEIEKLLSKYDAGYTALPIIPLLRKAAAALRSQPEEYQRGYDRAMLEADVFAASRNKLIAELQSSQEWVSVDVKQDGVWIVARSPEGKSAMLNLNNVVNDMDAGIIRSAFVGAIQATQAPPGAQP